jgi:hypothetical protein
MGFRIESTYCTHKNNIHHRIASSAPNPMKVFYVNVHTVVRNFPNIKTRVEEAVSSLTGEAIASQSLDGGTSHSTENEAGSQEQSQRSEEEESQEIRSEAQLLEEIVISDAEAFVGSDGHPLAIRAYGVRTTEGIRFDKADMFAAFGRTYRSDPNFIQATTVNVGDAQFNRLRDVITMWQFVELLAHCKRHGSENAELVFDWVISVVFSAQFGDGTIPTQADHAMGVGETLPREFGMSACGSYAYSFLEGGSDVVEVFACVADKLKELGIEGDNWSLKKGGHTEGMRGRLQAADIKTLLALHPKARISRGHFWHAPSKEIACKIEGRIRDDPIDKYRIRLPGCTFTELFLFPHAHEDWLHEEGQAIATKVIMQAVDQSELATLKLECKHRAEVANLRNEMASLREDKDAQLAKVRQENGAQLDKMRDDKDAQITKLRDEKVKIAHAAARMLCPKKKLITLDHLFET